MRARLAGFVGGVIAACFGCGGDDESAVAECRALRHAICDATRRCELLADEADESYETCVILFDASVACEDAARVSRSYDQCLAELGSRACVAWSGAGVGLPVSCAGAIELR